MDTVIVIPNHHPNLDFLKGYWWDEFPIIIVQDIGPKPQAVENITVYDHDDIKKDLGKKDWIIPTGTSACRSYGYLKAYQTGAKYILTLDNDCFPSGPRWITEHVNNLTSKTTLGWVNTGPNIKHRGFPYGIRDQSPVYLSHGLWSNVPDLDAPTALHNPTLRYKPTNEVETIPRHNFFPMCGMNLAWRRDLTPAMYFGLFGPDYGFDQYDDIWAGVLVKRVMDHLGYAAVSGRPSVEHQKQSNVFVNLKKQAPGMQMNEELWKIVRDINLTGDNVIDCYGELIQQLPGQIPGDVEGWLIKFKKAALLWLDLFR